MASNASTASNSADSNLPKPHQPRLKHPGWRLLHPGTVKSSSWRRKSLVFTVEVAKQVGKFYHKTTAGYKAGIRLAIFASATILIVNSFILGILIGKHKPDGQGIGLVTEGPCDQIKTVDNWAHIAINGLSTLLVTQSNYAMQVLVSPTRDDVDRAHRRKTWVDIGIPSFRNIWQRHIDWYRALCWMILAISSVPIHLLWNSVLFVAPLAYQYNEITVTNDFIEGKPFGSAYVPLLDSEHDTALWPDNLQYLREDIADPNMYDKLDIMTCKREYAQNFVQKRGDVVVVVTNGKDPPRDTSPGVYGGSSAGWGQWQRTRPIEYNWLCAGNLRDNFACRADALRDSPEWVFGRYGDPKVQYCLSKKMPERCRWHYGSILQISVIVANALKFVCFCIALRLIKAQERRSEKAVEQRKHGHKLLITTGDAIASFLEFPDPETRGMSTAEQEDFRNGIWSQRWSHIHPMVWRERSTRKLFRAIGVLRWCIGIFLFAGAAGTPIIFLLWNRSYLQSDLNLRPQDLDLGKPNGLFLLGKITTGSAIQEARVFWKVVCANLPQLILSIVSYLWNSHVAAMFAALEYDRYAAVAANPISKPQAHNNAFPRGLGWIRSVGGFFHWLYLRTFPRFPTGKHGLRVSIPEPDTAQVSERFLTIPFRYWFPNFALWAGVHYTASQAIFYARLDVLDHWGELGSGSIAQVGYSPLGLILAAVVALLLFGFAVLISLMTLPNRIPLAGANSAAVSAACHPRLGQGHHRREVHWGVERGVEGKWCVFTSGEVDVPELGVCYA